MAFSCIFCGSTTGSSKEHVVSRDTRSEFQFSGPVSIFVGDSDDPFKVEEYLAVNLGRQICETCNNGWMNQLEDRVRPFFHEMLLNKGPIELNAQMQRDFARWATVKALLIERSMRQRYANARASQGYSGSGVELEWLAKHDDPVPRSRVWLGAFDAENSVAVSHRSNLSESPAGTPAHVTTVTWGYTVFQVFSTDFVAADAASDEDFPFDPPPPFSAVLKRVWPLAGPTVSWPGEAFVSRSDLDALATWGGLLAPPATGGGNTSPETDTS
jgi:hypothetical protein